MKRLSRALHRLRTSGEPPEGLGLALLVGASVSFLLLGVLMRAGSAAPGGPASDAVFQVSLAAGMVAFNLAFFLAVLIVAWTAWAWRAARPSRSVLLSVVLVLVLVPFPPGLALRSVGIALAAAWFGARALSSSRIRPLRPAPLAAVAGPVFLLAVVAVFVALAAGDAAEGASVAGSSPFRGAAEALVVAAAIATPFALRCTFDRRAALVAAIAAAAFAAVALRTALAPLVTMWALSLSLYLPLPAYVGGLAAVAYAFAERLPREGARGSAAGLLLLALAGIGMGSSYEALMILVGLLWLLTRGPFAHAEREASSTPAGAAAEAA